MVVATGELIRAMNYVDDITTTLRRMCLYIPSMNAEERKRLAEYLRAAGGASTQRSRTWKRWRSRWRAESRRFA